MKSFSGIFNLEDDRGGPRKWGDTVDFPEPGSGISLEEYFGSIEEQVQFKETW